MRAYQDMVFSTAARLAGNDTQAEDIAQEVFIRAYEHFSDLRSSVTAGGLSGARLGIPAPRDLEVRAPRLSVQADDVSERWVRRVQEHLTALEAPEPA